MKKNHIKTNSYRTIKKSFPRFLSLMIMSLLGVLVFVGLTATSPDMLNTLDKFFDDKNTYDIKLLSTLGLTEDDLNALKDIDTIEDIEGIYSKDILIQDEETEIVLNISSLPKKINELELIDGRLPENDTEIVVEKNFLTKLNYNLNDKLIINDEVFKNKEVTIVGTVRSPLYYNNTAINQNRGTTTIGTGTINYYSYILPSNFDIDYYTNIFITVKNAKKEITSKTKYNELIEDTLNKIESIKTFQEESRYNTIYNDASNKIITEENKINKELKEAKIKLDDAKTQLNKAKKELDFTKTQLTSSKKQLDNAYKELERGKKEFQNTKDKYGIENIANTLNDVNNSINNLTELLKNIPSTEEEYQVYKTQLEKLYEQQYLLNTLKNTEDLLNNNTSEYNKNYSKYQTANNLYSSGLKQYNKNLKIYNDSLNEYEDNKKIALKEINDAYTKLTDIKRPKWYINTREDDQTYSSYINQTKSLNSLAKLFPLVFYAVAILVSLISMNRMVEDDRGEIGTLKSLGFTNHEIKKKYTSFSLLATLIGAIIGTIIGLTIIPYIIFTIYRLLFDVPNFQIGLNINSTLTGIIIAIICICGSSIITANKILKEKPATLMRPKAPKAGKKILLEKFTWLWHKIKFSNKITIRNILRYKKRVLVTIFGISGCTALILCGFGIKDSIVDITNMQYVNTFKYDATVFTNDLNIEKLDKVLSNSKIKSYTLSETLSGTLKDSNINIIVTENNDISKIINLVNKKNEKLSNLENNKIVITDKLADLYKIKEGDKVTFYDSEKNEYNLEVSNIVKNYLGHYIYINKETLKANQKEYKPNVIYLNTDKLSSQEEKDLSNELLATDEIINVIYTSDLVNSASDMLSSLDKVVIILVLLSAMLSFVVLYNLSNINITERKREIATLKVLGFYDNEIDNYITKENIILTIIGIAIGLLFGYFLTNMTISTVEMENARFIRHIKINSYIYSSLISCLFTFIVNIVTHFTLKKIDMIESLKSVE